MSSNLPNDIASGDNNTSRDSISNRLFERNNTEPMYVNSNRFIDNDLSRLARVDKPKVEANNTSDYYINNQNNQQIFTDQRHSITEINEIRKKYSIKKESKNVEKNSSDILNERMSRFTPISKTNTYPLVDNIFFKK